MDQFEVNNALKVIYSQESKTPIYKNSLNIKHLKKSLSPRNNEINAFYHSLQENFEQELVIQVKAPVVMHYYDLE